MGLSSIARQSMKASARLADRVKRPEQGIVLAIYHRVGATRGGQMNLLPNVFNEQIEWLAANRRVISLDQAADELSSGSPVQPGVVLTFDDGTWDWIDVAAPILSRHKVPATFYLTTGYADGAAALPDGERALSWAGVRELAAIDGMTIGSHTHTHALLDRLEPSAIATELDRSIELIGEHVGAAPAHFAYPKALEPSPSADSAVRARFRTAVIAGTRANAAGADLHLLRRSPIQGADSPDDARRKFDGGMGFEDELRRRINTVRYRGRTQ